MKEQDAEINALFNKISELEIRVENQEQYSRRTSLRFHNIKVPVDQRFGMSIYYFLLFVDGYLLTFNSFNKGFNVTVNT
jgi:hypothetical protein